MKKPAKTNRIPDLISRVGIIDRTYAPNEELPPSFDWDAHIDKLIADFDTKEAEQAASKANESTPKK